jgi:putative transposase
MNIEGRADGLKFLIRDRDTKFTAGFDAVFTAIGVRIISHRPHRTLQQNPPAGRSHPPAIGTNIRVLRQDRLGGLIREYAQVA